MAIFESVRPNLQNYDMNRRLLALLVILPAILAAAQQNAVPTEAEPALNLRIIEGVEVKFPDHSIFYHRVAPPAAPAGRVPLAVPVPHPLSLAESAAAEARASKKSAVLVLSATVYDHRVTELRWRSGNRDFHAWSNLDFNYLAGLGEVETADCIYFLIMGLGNETRESAAEWERFAAGEGLADRGATKALPDLATFPGGRYTYLLTAEAPAADSLAADTLAALDALHRYYDANSIRLFANYAEREATRTAREQWLKEHPPAPKNTVINFWPKKSRNYPTGK
jgi:hypothetical protein